jgi:hypothetical protein
MMNPTSGSGKRRKKDLKVSRGGLALGYEVLEIRDEGDEGMFLTSLCRETIVHMTRNQRGRKAWTDR